MLRGKKYRYGRKGKVRNERVNGKRFRKYKKIT